MKRRASVFLSTLSLVATLATGQGVEVDLAAVEEARETFIDRMVSEHGFDRTELAQTLGGATINQGVLEAISRPAERVLAWHEYREIFLNEDRITGGVQFWQSHADEIAQASEAYGVAPEMLVAILGVETYYGRRMGSYRVLDSLATLAFAYPPRAPFFSSELEAFFLLVREEGMDAEDVLGSYAGAMGAGQFISSSFRFYAVDGNDDGRRDLWRDWQDVLASVANYFSSHGWRQGESVVDRATRSSGWSGSEPLNSLDLEETVGSLSRSGYAFSTEFPAQTPATVLALEGEQEQEYWVGYHNFHVITRYNRSVKYALAAHQLGQIILEEYQKARSAALAQVSK